MNHQKDFYDFIQALNDGNIRYVIIRGYKDLPEKPDTDIDLVYHYKDYDKGIVIAKRYMNNLPPEEYGFSEYTKMIYHPFFTRGEGDPALPNGHFRVDMYSSFFFKSPMNNFSSFWNLSHEFVEHVFSNRYQDYDFGVYLPDRGSDIALLICRDIFDRREWKQKHLHWIEFLSYQIPREDILKAVKMIFPEPEAIVSLLIDKRYAELKHKLEGMMR
jgi:hypothetical protein